MKSITKIKCILALLFMSVSAQSILAQSKADVFDSKKPVTFLGVDYSQTKFIGTPTNTSVGYSMWTGIKKKDNGLVSNDEFRDSFTVQWNQLFLDEAKKYDIAKAVHRESVKYALDVAISANKKLTKKEFFSNNPGDFKTINEATIADIVKKYDFQNNDGIGLIFFVEGMSKGEASMGVWVTFVDIKSKTVLYTTYKTGKPGGSGFRNYWAKPLYTIIKDMESDFKSWGKN